MPKPPSTFREAQNKAEWARLIRSRSYRTHIKKLRRLLQRTRKALLRRAGTTRHRQRHAYALGNMIGDLCRSVLPPIRAPPRCNATTIQPTPGTKHKVIPATTPHAQLQATRHTQGNLMTDHPGKNIHFLDRAYDHVGLCGITYHTPPHRTFTEADLDDYCPGIRHTLPKAKIDRLIQIQNKFGASLSRPPPHTALQWPFRYDPTTDHYDADDLLSSLKASVGAMPGKARHKSFTLNLLDRLPEDFTLLLHDIRTLTLTTRIQPRDARDHTRTLAPKGGSLSDCRPIAGADDFGTHCSG